MRKGAAEMGSRRILNVGVLQTEVELKGREKNQKRIREHLKKCTIPSGAPTVLALPELWDVGYCLNEAASYADKGGREAITFLSELAKEYGVWFAGGSTLVEEDGKFFNRTHVINPKGELVAQYDKAHLLPFITSEVGILTGGRSTAIYQIGDASCGSIICYDIRFPEWVRVYALSGIDVLFVSAEWTINRMQLWNHMIKAHAISNSIYVVAVNLAGKSGDITYGGGSLVCAPSGEALFTGSESEDIGFVTLDLDSLKETREFLKVFESRVPQLYTKLTEEKK